VDVHGALDSIIAVICYHAYSCKDDVGPFPNLVLDLLVTSLSYKAYYFISVCEILLHSAFTSAYDNALNLQLCYFLLTVKISWHV
jgi:hypothetical protein